MKELTIQEERNVIIEILDFVDKICKENNIKYCLAFGTLLGAVRHDGFIPWDDDIDIHLKRSDYEKLKDIFKNNSFEYEFLDFETDPKYPLFFGKISDKRTKYVFQNKTLGSYDLGMNIDVFPLEEVSSEIESKAILKKLKNHGNLSCFKSYKVINGDGILKNTAKLIIGSLFCWVNTYKNNLRVKEIFKRIKGNDYLFSYCEYTLDKYGYDWFDETIPHLFEGKEYQIPKKYDLVLKQNFGDYMQLPPIEKRISTHVYNAYWRD